ncbi:D-alanine--D-alanine ligase family protein [Spirilliplanes yamanashiensis]|uniref:D-alanine--D-alanine ligase n=1 Tax=Spirilliplanes yamanashiensis TaxID=42233 RepID=A0A8J4DGY8_9ACTN|nr:D-alanine--D-alanine ligase family protein [Spirilliplanes yamanashiensis]MDP9820012.1 D-alanine-D-alanine ligase [Spirilliplanes yamanashiensis]GIJ01169.1 D-alanine--D-alanine ligase [Spirilliplanes yamanashiensis]
MRRTRVAVLFGGPSAEHDVSCASALGVVRALTGDAYEPVAVGINRDGRFRLVPGDVLEKLRDQPPPPRAIDDRLEVTGADVELRAGAERGRAVFCAPGSAEVLAEVDVVFPVLHGPFGEDGVIQGVLESVGVPYVGCGIAASAVGMDKVAMKRAFLADGVPVTPHVWLDVAQWEAAAGNAEPLVAGLARPLFVKPANMGSSIGISRVADGDDLAAALDLAFRYDSAVIVEQGVTGREIECSVLGGLRPEASPVGEVTVANGWFDYEQKYFGDSDPMIVPAVLPEDVERRVRELSVAAFRAVGGWGLARVDFLYDEAAGRLYVNELNTMPGFTAHSMYPKVWAVAGLGYVQLVDRLVGLAFERQELRAGRTR